MTKALRLLVVSLLLTGTWAAETKPSPGQIQPTMLNGLAYDLTLSLDGAQTKSESALTVAATGNQLGFANGKITLSLPGFAPLTPIPFTASKIGDLVKLEMVEKGHAVLGADKKEAASILITGAITDNGAGFTGVLTWTGHDAAGKGIRNTFAITGSRVGAASAKSKKARQPCEKQRTALAPALHRRCPCG